MRGLRGNRRFDEVRAVPGRRLGYGARSRELSPVSHSAPFFLLEGKLRIFSRFLTINKYLIRRNSTWLQSGLFYTPSPPGPNAARFRSTLEGKPETRCFVSVGRLVKANRWRIRSIECHGINRHRSGSQPR